MYFNLKGFFKQLQVHLWRLEVFVSLLFSKTKNLSYFFSSPTWILLYPEFWESQVFQVRLQRIDDFNFILFVKWNKYLLFDLLLLFKDVITTLSGLFPYCLLCICLKRLESVLFQVLLVYILQIYCTLQKHQQGAGEFSWEYKLIPAQVKSLCILL